MEESTTYQMIMARGRLLGKREDLLLQGREKFGPPDEATVERIQSITDPQRLEQLLVRLLQVSDWQGLLARPGE